MTSGERLEVGTKTTAFRFRRSHDLRDSEVPPHRKEGRGGRSRLLGPPLSERRDRLGPGGPVAGAGRFSEREELCAAGTDPGSGGGPRPRRPRAGEAGFGVTGIDAV